MTHPKYINPFTDFGFKKIFGDENNKDLLISFLNELLAEQGEHIHKLHYKKNKKLGHSSVDRDVIYDLYCENEKGEKFIVEMQKAKQSFFKDRMVYYSSFSIQEQGVKGKETDELGNEKVWNYELKAVYVIGILDFVFDENNKEKIVVSHNKLMDIQRKTVFYDKLTFVTIQMPNFTKTIDDLETNFDKWLYVIKNLNRLDNIPEKLQDKIFQKVFDISEYAAMDKSERANYEDSLKYYRDLQSTIDTAEEDGIKKGIKTTEKKLLPIIEQKDKALEQKNKVIEQNKQEIKQKDQALEQKDQALKQNKQVFLNNAKLMKSLGATIEQIQKSTGLTRKEIEDL